MINLWSTQLLELWGIKSSVKICRIINTTFAEIQYMGANGSTEAREWREHKKSDKIQDGKLHANSKFNFYNRINLPACTAAPAKKYIRGWVLGRTWKFLKTFRSSLSLLYMR